MKKVLLYVTAIIILMLVIFIWLLALRFPALFMNLEGKPWLNENLGKPLINESDINLIKCELPHLPIEKRNSVLSTIGTAAYLDGHDDYCNKARKTNIILKEKFSALYEKVLNQLSERLDAKCEYADHHDIALPGFHIFPGNSLLGRQWNIASLHVDLQEHQVPWPDTHVFDWSKTYSFTIPISVTPDSGLYIFNRKAENCGSGWVPLCYTLRNVERQKIYYKNGWCYLHHGKYFHLISSFEGKNIRGEYTDRITLQGHCIYCITTSSYWVYW